MENWVKYLAIGMCVLLVGGLLGVGLARLSESRIAPDLIAEEPSNAKDKYNLGQNAFEPPKVKAKPTRYSDPESVDHNVGTIKNGKRLLVPGEPAIKKERDVLEAREEAIAGYFGESGESQDEAISNYQDSMNPGEPIR